MRKYLLATAAVFLMIGGAAAQDSNTSQLFNETDFVVQDSWTGDAFTAESLGNFSANIALDANESLEATLTGYNSSSEAGNVSWSLKDGSTEFDINNSNFGNNVTTYVLDLNASNGTVSVLDLEITGMQGNNTAVSGAAPVNDGFMTGLFSAVPSFADLGNAFSNFFAGIGEFLGGIFK